eukprot:scaffold170357_cov30-Tisochrysis_lutea.AAC.1
MLKYCPAMSSRTRCSSCLRLDLGDEALQIMAIRERVLAGVLQHRPHTVNLLERDAILQETLDHAIPVELVVDRDRAS